MTLDELPVLLTSQDYAKLIDQARSNPGEWTGWWRNAPVNNIPSTLMLRAMFSTKKGRTQGEIVFAAVDNARPGTEENMNIGFGFSPSEATNMLARKLYGTKNFVKALIRVVGPWVLLLVSLAAGLLWLLKQSC